MRWSLILGLVLLLPALAGCFGGDEEPSQAGLETRSRAQVSEDTGGVEGTVTDEAVQPIQGANVTLEGYGSRTTTTTDGSFAFSNVPPGEYTLDITARGFLGTERTVQVEPNQVSVAEILLAHQPTVRPYKQQLEFTGFIECSVAANAAVASGSVNACSAGNGTNSKTLFHSRLEENAWQIVTEMQWEPTSALAERLTLIVEPEGFGNADKVTLAEDDAEAPIVLETDRARLTGVVRNASAICSGEEAPVVTSNAASESYCNLQLVDEGGPLQIRVFSSGVAAGGRETAGGVIQQEFTVVQTIFYNAPACESFSVFQESPCPQRDQPPTEDPYAELVGRDR